MQTTKDRIRHFIADELGWDAPATELTDDLALLEEGVLDSLGIYELVRFLEEEVGVEIGDDDLIPENFATIDDIARVVADKARDGAGSAG